MIMFILTVSFAILSEHILINGYAIAIQKSEYRSHVCNSITTNNATYHRLNQTLYSWNCESVRFKYHLETFCDSAIFEVHSPLGVDLLDKKGRVLAHYPTDIIISRASVVLAFSLRVMESHGIISNKPAIAYVLVKHNPVAGQASGITNGILTNNPLP
jgi:hypothetical protein